MLEDIYEQGIAAEFIPSMAALSSLCSSSFCLVAPDRQAFSVHTFPTYGARLNPEWSNIYRDAFSFFLSLIQSAGYLAATSQNKQSSASIPQSPCAHSR
jgi:hypothetical protein